MEGHTCVLLWGMSQKKEECMFRSLQNKKGQNTLEYVLMLVFVVGIVMVLFSVFKPQFQSIVGNVGSKIQEAIGALGGGQ
ncbi:MAG: hypothetical protein A3B70_04420 [Deltaproteobacteria bacterium RIFCSPHIGHO2_02_FULL_40_11]|nr:MAG: hypothetical protein A3B70_04420 [Deltaproteobacteria bacterium RIFCSPHIGHO2_02_FULL_40_11]